MSSIYFSRIVSRAPHAEGSPALVRLAVIATLILMSGAFIKINAAVAITRTLCEIPRFTTVDEEFGVKEYDDFHRVLHHLQHEALPKNDIATIRSRAKELIKLGAAIVKLGVPAGTKEANLEVFKKELERFAKALEKYGADAESGSDSDLKNSYGAVHDSFEELAVMLPRK